MKIPYPKKALTIKEQLEKLKSRGLIITDESLAEQILSNISYYRLSAYMYPFLKDKPNHIYKDGTTFNEIKKLYDFDHELRILIFDAISEIEVSLKTKIIYYLAQNNGAFWLEDENLFHNKNWHEEQKNKIIKEIERSDETFIKHFRNKYNNSIPPVWMTLEISSFGLISQIYKNIKSQKTQKEIAQLYKLPHSLFASWLHSITYLRNICAHHLRLWNRELGIAPVLPYAKNRKSLGIISDTNKRIFILIEIMNYFLQIIGSKRQFLTSLKLLLQKYPNVDLETMGFPENWEENINNRKKK